MKQNVRFSGLNLSVDEQAVENGALAVCDGMEVHNGALRPCVIEGEAVQNENEILGEILYIHELTNGRKNAIYVDDTLHTLYYIDITGTEAAVELFDSGQTVISRDMINAVTSNGNTLVLLTVNGIKYFRWYNNDYKYLGKMPELEMQFSLKKGENMKEDFGVETPSGSPRETLVSISQWAALKYAYYVDKDVKYDESDTLLVREESMEAALSILHSKCQELKYFTHPFFVRYCYRLWDGRKVMHSAPALLFSDMLYTEMVFVYKHNSDDEHTKANYHGHMASLFPQKLYVKILNEDDVFKTIKEDWVDIIKSIDVYITPEISRRDENYTVNIPESGEYPWEGKWRQAYHWGDMPEQYNSIVALSDNLDADSHQSLDVMNIMQRFGLSKTQRQGGYDYRYAWDDNIRWANFDDEKFLHSYGVFTPVLIGAEQWRKRLVEQNAYYLLKRFDLIEETPETGVLPIDDGVLNNIEAQEQMITSTAPDDYRTHNEVVAKTSYVYNNRINLTGIEEILFKGFPVNMLPQMTRSDAQPPTGFTVVRLEENSKNVYVKTENKPTQMSVWYINHTFVFYPDTRAKEMWIYSTELPQYPDTGTLLAHFSLTEHPFLNGAYHMGVINEVNHNFNQDLPDVSERVDRSLITDDPRLKLPNYIFTSASGNPFVFPAAHRYAVGLGEVKAIASTTRALSQGQFGQYPLIAFASDGIYALDVSSTGSYSGIQPISREVITNTNALLQLDQSVAFITKRAISQLIESDVNDLSTQLSGPLRDLSTMLVNLPQTKTVGDLITAVQSSDAIYDFVNKRLLYFLMEDGAYTGDVLTFSANDNAWAFKSLGNVVKGVYNSYPYPYIHKTDGTLICLSEPYDNKDMGAYSGLIVSRTLKSEGYRNAIREFIQDYDIAEARPMLMLWGSDDNRTWHYVGKSNARQMGRLPGRIYKYFRLAVQFENLKRNDLYHGVILDIVERFVR